MNTPLRDELREILFKASGGISDMANEEIDQILNLIASKMPEKKDERLNKTSGSKYSPPQFIDIEARAYNQAITEVKSILKGGTE